MNAAPTEQRAAAAFGAVLDVLKAAQAKMGYLARAEVPPTSHEALEAAEQEGLLEQYGAHAYKLTDRGRYLVGETSLASRKEPPRPNTGDLIRRLCERIESEPNYGQRPRITFETRATARWRHWRATAASDGRRWRSSWCEALDEALEELLAMVPHGPAGL